MLPLGPQPPKATMLTSQVFWRIFTVLALFALLALLALEAGVWMLRSRRDPLTRERNRPMQQLQPEVRQPPEGGRAPILSLISGQTCQQTAIGLRLFLG